VHYQAMDMFTQLPSSMRPMQTNYATQQRHNRHNRQAGYVRGNHCTFVTSSCRATNAAILRLLLGMFFVAI
jgi:hypothetical protein